MTATITPQCIDCLTAEDHPQHPGYQADCLGCECRALAHGPEGWRAAQGLTNAPLRDAILLMAAKHSETEHHVQQRVWHWIGRLQGRADRG